MVWSHVLRFSAIKKGIQASDELKTTTLPYQSYSFYLVEDGIWFGAESGILRTVACQQLGDQNLKHKLHLDHIYARELTETEW